nr:uncharacterized protein LOC109150807 [Ipomoea batatas]
MDLGDRDKRMYVQEDFNELMFKEGLIDLGYVGSKYTWSRGQDLNTFRGASIGDSAMQIGNYDSQMPLSNIYR